MRATFFSYDDAMRFATENNCKNINSIKRPENISVSCSYYLSSPEIKAFFIEGFTEVVPCYFFTQQDSWNREKNEHDKDWYIDAHSLLIKNIITGDLFHIYQTRHNSKKFGLSLFYPCAKQHLNYFKTELEQPNFIGKPSRKKLQDWFTYLIDIDREKLDYINRAKCAIHSFTEKILAKFPDAKVSKDKQGNTTNIVVIVGAIRYQWEPTEKGQFYRTATIWKAPTDEELLK